MISDPAYLAWWIGSAPAAAAAVLGEDVIANAVAGAFRRTLAERTDGGWAERFRRSCPVGAVPADAYRLREVRLANGLGVLAGIHFYGGDVERPFVGIFAQTRDVSAAERLGVTPALCDAFAPFAPGATWWWTAGDGEGARDVDGATPDQRLLLGAIRDLVRTPVDPTGAPFTLRRDPTGSSYDAYDRVFAAFMAAHPAWEGRLARTSRDDYRACAEAGGLFVAEVDGEVAGVFAARPGEVRGVPGWLVEEELLADRWRGRGLAPLLQRMALAHLDTATHPLVLGTIDAANQPSLRTARRVGRVDAGGWTFVADPRREG